MLTILFECPVIRIAESKHSTVICTWTRLFFAVNFVVCLRYLLAWSSFSSVFCTPFWTCTGPLELLNPGGGGLPYESDGDARRLAKGCKLQILVPLRVHRTESQYFHLYRYCLGLCVKKYLYEKQTRHL